MYSLQWGLQWGLLRSLLKFGTPIRGFIPRHHFPIIIFFMCLYKKIYTIALKIAYTYNLFDYMTTINLTHNNTGEMRANKRNGRW